jgi:hypothetical protein
VSVRLAEDRVFGAVVFGDGVFGDGVFGAGVFGAGVFGAGVFGAGVFGAGEGELGGGWPARCRRLRPLKTTSRYPKEMSHRPAELGPWSTTP